MFQKNKMKIIRRKIYEFEVNIALKITMGKLKAADTTT